MRSLDNVTALRFDGSPGELAAELRANAEDGGVRDVAVVYRAPDGKLYVDFTPQTSGELAELAAWLTVVSHHQLAQEHDLPEHEVECSDEES